MREWSSGDVCTAQTVALRLLLCGAAVCLAAWAAAAAFRCQAETMDATADTGDVQPVYESFALHGTAVRQQDDAALLALLYPEEAAEAEPPQEDTAPVDEVQEASAADPVERVLELVNRYRAENGLAALALDSTLCSAAATRAWETTMNFSHTRPDGSQWYTVTSLAHGENIVMGTGMDADGAMQKWMNSPPHRASILDASFATLGIGYSASGSEVYWVQLFGY